MLSVVIITCNRASTVVKTIESCKDHCSIEWELVVVDNGSTDGTKDLIVHFCDEQKIDLQYHYSDSNLGVAGARNIGYELAKGEVLYFIDDDAFIVSEKCCLDDAYRYLMTHKEVQVLSTKIWDKLWNGILPEITALSAPMEDGVQLRSFIGCSHLIRKDDWLKSPIYPDNLFYGGEEIYLSYNIYKHNKSVEYFDGVFVEHYPSTNTRATKYEIYRNRVLNWYIVKKYYYPFPYILASKIVFFYRIIKLTQGSMIKLMEVRKVKKVRYDKRYCNKYSVQEMRMLIRKFKWRYLI